MKAIKLLLSNEKIITGIISIVVSLIVTIFTIKLNSRIQKKDSLKTLELNIKILINDIQELINYLEKIIVNRSMKSNHYLQELNFNKLLIDYNNLYGKKSKETVNNLLKFYRIRTRIEKKLLNKIKNCKEKEFENRLFYIAENIYIELDNLFLKENLKCQLKEWDKNFSFKSLNELKREQKKTIQNQVDELNEDIEKIKKENKIKLDLIYKLDESKLNQNQIYYKKEMKKIQSDYWGEKKDIEISNKTDGILSIDDAYYRIVNNYKEIYNKKRTLDSLE